MEAMCETYETEDDVDEDYYENGELVSIIASSFWC